VLLPLPLLLPLVLCVALSLIVLTDAVRVWWPSLFVPLPLPPLLGRLSATTAAASLPLRPADGAMVWGTAGVAAPR
jgi:hypothetical protein